MTLNNLTPVSSTRIYYCSTTQACTDVVKT
jgi:hypothetical protein